MARMTLGYVAMMQQLSHDYSQKYQFNHQQEDAFRHAFTSAYTSHMYGSAFATATGDLWEFLGQMHGADPDETRMDYYNNAKGREIEKSLQTEINQRLSEANQEVAGKIRDFDYIPNGVDKSNITDELHREELITNEVFQKAEQDIRDMIAERVKEYIDDGKLIIDPKTDYRDISTISAKLDGRDPSWGKGILEKLLKLSNSMNDGMRKFEDWIGDWFKPSRSNEYHIVDPLVLDLNGDGIKAVAQNGYGGAMFDFNANGIQNATGWISKEDGLLVLDRNKDGIINNGTELFGDTTPIGKKTAENGFAALASLDTNKDGKITAQDKQFAQLKIWQDLNGDGVSQKNELKTLKQLGITALNMAYKDSNQNLGNGNILAQVGSFEKKDGSTGTMGDVNLSLNSITTVFSNSVEMTDKQAANDEFFGFQAA